MNKHIETLQRSLVVGDVLRAVDDDERETYFWQLAHAEHQTAWIRPIASQPQDSTIERGWVVPVPRAFTGEARRCRILGGDCVEVLHGEFARHWKPLKLANARHRWAPSPSNRAALLTRQQLHRDRRVKFRHAAAIRAAIDEGRNVFWADWNFHVRHSGDGRGPEAYRIHSLDREAEIGLTLSDGWTLAADIDRFFCAW